MIAELCGTVIVAGIVLLMGLVTAYPALCWLNKQRKRLIRGIKYQKGRLIFCPSWWFVHKSQIYALYDTINRLEGEIVFMHNTHVKKQRDGQLYLEFVDMPRGHNGATLPFVDAWGNVFKIRAGDHEHIRAGDIPVVSRDILERYKRGDIDSFAKQVKWVKEDYKPQKGEVVVPEKYYSGLFILAEKAQQIEMFQEN